MPVNSSRRSGANRPPKYSRQKEKGRADRAYVWFDDKKLMLGSYGSAESRAKYNELIARASMRVDPEPSTEPTVSELIAAYLEHAETYYRDSSGKVGKEYLIIAGVCKLLRQQAGSDLASGYGPKKLKALRQTMIELGWCRSSINKQIGRVKRMFRWCAAEEMIPGSVQQNLSMLAGLCKGRSEAVEKPPVACVPVEVVEATLKHLPQVVGDMVRLQLLSGMRPGELLQLRPCDIDRTAKVWWYRPASHKTQHLGHSRAIAFGPKAQDVLRCYLVRDSKAFCFRPVDSEDKRLAARVLQRTTPMSCGNTQGSNRQAEPKTKPGDQYTTDSYRRAITRGAKRAGVSPWTPHRLRHTKATDIRKAFGLDSAQAVLGHRGAKVTEVYAELDTAKAAEVALRIG